MRLTNWYVAILLCVCLIATSTSGVVAAGLVPATRAWATELFATFTSQAADDDDDDDKPKLNVGITKVLGAAPSHPVVPGFERFYSEAASNADLLAAGKLLLGELNCVACHKADDAVTKSLLVKRSPILDGVGSRARVKFLRKFLANPQHAKPGSTMPDLWSGLSDADQAAQVESLVQFLATTGSVTEAPASRQLAKEGEQLFHEIGCVACHDAHKGDKPDSLSSSISLGHVADKFSIPGLIQFLKDPHKTRPSGRMPGFNLDDKRAQSLAHFFLRDSQVQLLPNMTFAYFEGSWDKLPDFATLKPVATGEAAAFDLHAGQRGNNFGMVFEGFLHVPRVGDYTFHLGSDDGSRLFIDGVKVVDVDGTHPHTEASGRTKLTAGPHPIRVEYFQSGGEWTLTLQFESKDLGRQEVSPFVTPTREPPPAPKSADDSGFVPRPELADAGRKLFTSAGCASCHPLKAGNENVASDLKARPFRELSNPTAGCLADSPAKGLPNFRLSTRQRQALALAIKSLGGAAPASSPADVVAHTLTAFNCYACHVRGLVGGIEALRNSSFTTTMPEMGDEGRLPPHLDGVGDKLKSEWLKHVLANGSDERPYMRVNMPKFGHENVGHLVALWEQLDRKDAAEMAKFDDPPGRLKGAGRQLVGDKAFGCIKCHNFLEHKATGIQSVELTKMTQRLREDWFYRYMLNPQEYRPGTRMPTPWPFGTTTAKDVLDANVQKQQFAMWRYLSDGNKAQVPTGIIRDPIVLTPTTEPIIYRNFIEGANPRAIAVGYPEKAHLTFDAENCALVMLWQGDFIDASRHWSGRGNGFQGPQGDNVIPFAAGVSFAALLSLEAAWPDKPAREQGYKFRGYRFDKSRRPTFIYEVGSVRVEDFPHPVTGNPPSLDRTITLTNSEATGGAALSLWFRAATGSKIESAGDGTFAIDGVLKLSVAAPNGIQPVVRLRGNSSELLVPVSLNAGNATLNLKYVW
jgi:mono/diheme cytochrome c family protein